MGHRRWRCRVRLGPTTGLALGVLLAALALGLAIYALVQVPHGTSPGPGNNNNNNSSNGGGGGGGHNGTLPPLAPVTLVPGTHPVCAPVTVTWDAARGQPTVTATNDLDGHVGMGYAMGALRLFQMDVFRRQGNASLAALLGNAYFETDVALFEFDPYPDKAARFAALDEPVREEMEAWAAGVNAWLDAPGPVPAEYVALGFPSKARVARFEGADVLRIWSTLEVSLLDYPEAPATFRLLDLLGLQPIANVSSACVSDTGFLPFSLAASQDCANLVRFVLVDLLGGGDATSLFATPLATEYLTFYNTTPPLSATGAGFTATASATRALPVGAPTAAAALVRALANRSAEVDRLRERLPARNAGGSLAVALSGGRSPAPGKTLLSFAPDQHVILPGFVTQVRLVVTGTANATCGGGGHGTRGTPASALVQMYAGVPASFHTANLSVATPLRFADLVDVFLEVLEDDGAGNLAALSGRAGEEADRRAVVPLERVFSVNVGNGVVVDAPYPYTSLRIPDNNNAIVIVSFPTEDPSQFLAATMQTALPQYWRLPAFEQLVRCPSVAALHALYDAADSGLPLDLVSADASGHTGHLTVGPRVPLREDFELLRAPDLVSPMFDRDGFSAVPHRWLRAAVPGPDGFPFERLPRNESCHVIDPADGVLTAANQDATGIDTFDPVLGTRRYRWTTGGMVYLAGQPIPCHCRYSGLPARAHQVRQELARQPAPHVPAAALAGIQASTESAVVALVRDLVVEAYDWAAAHPNSTAAATYLGASPTLASAMQVLRPWRGTCRTAAAGAYDWGDNPAAPPPAARTGAARDESAGCTVATVTLDALVRQHSSFLCGVAYGVDPADVLTATGLCPVRGEQALAWLARYNTSATPGLLASGLDVLAASDPPAATRDDRKALWVLRAFDAAVRALRDPARFPAFGGATDAHTYTWGKLNRYRAPHRETSMLAAPLTVAAGDGGPSSSYPMPGTYGSPWPALFKFDTSPWLAQNTYQDQGGENRFTQASRLVAERGAGAPTKLDTVLQLGASGFFLPNALTSAAHVDDQLTHWIANAYYRED